MRLFQILGNEVNIVKDEQFYSDTVENYLLDGGTVEFNGEKMTVDVHDSQQNYCEVNGIVLAYSNEFFENIIDGIDTLVAKKAEREYVEPKPPTAEEIQEQLEIGIEAWMNTVVAERDYDSIDTCIARYTDSPNPKYAQEAKAVKDWNTAVWDRCWELLAEVQAGTRPIPTLEEVIAELPVLVW